VIGNLIMQQTLINTQRPITNGRFAGAAKPESHIETSQTMIGARLGK
jgi:hypothetical protein